MTCNNNNNNPNCLTPDYQRERDYGSVLDNSTGSGDEHFGPIVSTDMTFHRYYINRLKSKMRTNGVARERESCSIKKYLNYRHKTDHRKNSGIIAQSSNV